MANTLNSLAKTLLSSDVLNSISKQTKISTDDVSSILSTALPALLGGANKQATQKSTAESFLNALKEHGTSNTNNIASFLKKVDIEDGAKIVKHLLGTSTNTIAKNVAKTSKTGIKTEDVVKVLSIAAPLIMSLIGKQTSKKKDSDVTTALSSVVSLLGNKEVETLAVSLLGTKSKKKNDIDLGDVLSIAGKFLK